MGYDEAKKAIEESIAAANLGYIDLYGFRIIYNLYRYRY